MRELIGEAGEFLVLGDGIGMAVFAPSVCPEDVAFRHPSDFNGVDVDTSDFQYISFSLVGDAILDRFAPLFYVKIFVVRFHAGY